MELFKYIVKFIYRIRWWMVIFPCIAGIIAWFLTRNLEKTYDVKTTIFTGIISGYNVDATDTRNATVHMSNLMNIITTERTLKIVSLKLLARCLVYGDAERNTSYISAIHYQQLVSGIPRELQALQLSTALLPHLNTQEQRVINLLSTEEKDGKTHVARLIEEYWSSIGLNVRRITYDEDFLSEDSQYVQANNLKELCPDLEKDEILLIEHPVLKSNPLPPALLNEASINLLVVRANRTWKNTDQALYEHLLQVKQKEVPLLFYLTQADRNTVEDFTGQLPPYTNFKNMEYRLFQLGLTAIEYKGK